MDGKLSPDVAPPNQPRRADRSADLILTSRREAPTRRPRLIEHGRGDNNVTDPEDEALVLRSRRRE